MYEKTQEKNEYTSGPFQVLLYFFSVLGMHRARASRARRFSDSVILGLGHARARLFPLSKILDTVIHIVAALVIDNAESVLSITNAATM